MHRLVLAAAAVALIGACAATPSGEAARVISAAAGTPAPNAAAFVRMAGASDLYEIQSSQILLQSSEDADLRRFAQMMIDHHTRTSATVTAAAREAGLTPPSPALDPAKSQMIRELQAAQGVARDRLYQTQQVTAHREALTLHSGYAAGGDAPGLKRAAAMAVPIVAEHYNMLVKTGQGRSPDHDQH